MFNVTRAASQFFIRRPCTIAVTVPVSWISTDGNATENEAAKPKRAPRSSSRTQKGKTTKGKGKGKGKGGSSSTRRSSPAKPKDAKITSEAPEALNPLPISIMNPNNNITPAATTDINETEPEVSLDTNSISFVSPPLEAVDTFTTDNTSTDAPLKEDTLISPQVVPITNEETEAEYSTTANTTTFVATPEDTTTANVTEMNNETPTAAESVINTDVQTTEVNNIAETDENTKCANTADTETATATATNTNADKCPSSRWSPSAAEYESLITDLLIYRRESLAPAIEALCKERMQLDQSIKRMEEHTAELYALREEIRGLITNSAATQRQALADALQMMDTRGAVSNNFIHNTRSYSSNMDDDELEQDTEQAKSISPPKENRDKEVYKKYESSKSKSWGESAADDVISF